MQVSVENTSALERRLTVQIPAADIQSKIDSRLRELSKQVRIKGFRPGRVPMNLMRQRYGTQVRQEIVNEAVQSGIREAIQTQDLRPASQPRIDTMPDQASNGDLEFSALVEVYPELETVDVSSVEIEPPETQVTEADVDDMLETLREQRRHWHAVDRKPTDGDQVLLEYVAETDEGRVPPQGRQRLAIIVGASGFDALESAISDLGAGEKTNTRLAFPADYREAGLSGREADVELTLVSVSEGHLPDIDEAFIRGFGIESGDMETLRREVRANLERELKQARTSVIKVALIRKLVGLIPNLEVPESIVRDEAASMAAQAAGSQGREPDPRHVEQFMEAARGRVRGGLIMGELARQNGIRIDGARVRDAIDTIADTYEQSDEVKQMYYGNPQLLQSVENAVLEEQVVDWVLEHAKVTPKPMAFKEVIEAASKARR